jgi:hypothetical protein
LWEARHGVKVRAASVDPVGCVGEEFLLGGGEVERRMEDSEEEREKKSEEEWEPVWLDLWNEDRGQAEDANEKTEAAERRFSV